ncbi:MAG: MFS transporter [Sphingomonadales bacterium]|nr:MFS transporter [Sphingomonadales bacterium]
MKPNWPRQVPSSPTIASPPDVRRDSPRLALIVLTAIGTAGFIDRIVMNVLVEPLKREFGLSDTQIGLLTGLAFAVLNVTLGIAVARLAERQRRLSLIALGTLLWSLATALCGAVTSWPALLLARVAVGVGEAVGLPANQSVIADYTPPHRRASAMSVLLLAPPLGAFIGAAGGAWVAGHWGWRWAFVAAALPGFVLAAAAWLFVAEPPRGRHDAADDGTVPPLGAVVARFWQLPSARHLVAGSTVASMVGFGLNAFFAAMLARRFGFSLIEAGLAAGVVASLPASLSVLTGGWLADRLGKTRPAAYALVPGLSLIAAAPLYALAMTRGSSTPLLVLVGLAALLQYTYLGCTYGTLQNLMSSRMRATASALLNAVYSLVGAGIGPLLLGAASDALLARGLSSGGALSLAMAGFSLVYLWAGAHYLLAARHIGPDLAATRAAP